MRNIARYFIHSIVLVRGGTGTYGVGVTVYGEPVDASAPTPTLLTLPARVEWDNRRVVNEAGEEVVCAASVSLPASYVDGAGATVALVVGPQDRIIFEGREHAVVTRGRQEGWAGDRGQHIEVWIV